MARTRRRNHDAEAIIPPPWEQLGWGWEDTLGPFGDQYFTWARRRYWWDADDPRVIADTHTLWDDRRGYGGFDDVPD